MKILTLFRKTLDFVVLFNILILSASIVSAQETVTIPVSDLKIFQKAALERDFFKTAYEDEKTRSAAWEKSAMDWKALAASEKNRADNIQGARIVELNSALKIYEDQSKKDAKKIGEQNATIASLKSGRKWWFTAGAALGSAAGAYITHKLSNNTIVVPGFANLNQNRPAYGVTFKF